MFSSTVRKGKSAYDWKTVLTFRLWGGVWATSRPSRRIPPSVGCSNPAIRRRVVVFPQPDGPSSEKNSPPTTSRLMPSTAVTSAKRLTRSTIWTWPPVMNQDLKRFANNSKLRVPGNRTLTLSIGAPPARRGAAIRAIAGKAEEGASLVGWRPTTTPPGAALGGAAGPGPALPPRAQQSCCWVLLLTYGVRYDGNDRRAGPSRL